MQDMFTLLNFYKFITLDSHSEYRPQLLELCQRYDVKGTIILSPEGVNGAIVSTEKNINLLISYFRTFPHFEDIHFRKTSTDFKPFYRLKIKLKPEIIAIRNPLANPLTSVGEYVDAEDWNDIIRDPNTIVLDVRNKYESDVGTFDGAVVPNFDRFSEFPKYVQEHMDPQEGQKVALFCTGGIKTEKASSYLLNAGFSDVVHLKDGILGYLNKVPKEDSLWRGECFVFDNRVSVEYGNEQGKHSMCYGCRHPIEPEDKQHPYYEEGVSCPLCFQKTTNEDKSRFRQRQQQMTRDL
jgi:UPF0176 protein